MIIIEYTFKGNLSTQHMYYIIIVTYLAQLCKSKAIHFPEEPHKCVSSEFQRSRVIFVAIQYLMHAPRIISDHSYYISLSTMAVPYVTLTLTPFSAVGLKPHGNF